MPTVRRIDGYRVVIYPADHFPSHVHVIGGGTEAIFNLNCPNGPVVLRENYGFSRGAVTRMLKALGQVLPALCQAWSRIHGQAR
jgi:hypothetical protein